MMLKREMSFQYFSAVTGKSIWRCTRCGQNYSRPAQCSSKGHFITTFTNRVCGGR
jgi:hypothetical protein